jgi:hypothetical protein
MNFSTVPPCLSSSLRKRSQYGPSTARTSSGSSRSARDVNPTRSAKSTETTFRSSRPGSAVSAAPQAEQKRAPSGLSRSQTAQLGMAPSLWRLEESH